MTTPHRSHRQGFESIIQALIMLAVAGMAGAASFTHVHDWTMHNSPAGTGDWFGWANAMVSELIPLAAGLEARRRIRLYGHAGIYPIALIISAVALSLTGQFAEATPSTSGWLIAAVPALGFLALVKLVLSGPTTPTPTAAIDDTFPRPTSETVSSAADQPPIRDLASVSVPIPTHLISAARYAATNHRHTTGGPITATDLAAQLSVTPAIATGLLATLDAENNARINGYAPAGTR